MTNIFQKLRADLDDVTRNAMSRARDVSFVRVKDPHRDEFVTLLAPSVEQRQVARDEAERFARWSRTVAAVLRRRGASSELEKLTRLTKEMTKLLLLDRQDVATVTEGRWRREFERDLAQFSVPLHGLLTSSESSFDIHQHRRAVEYVPFEVRVVENAPGRWIVQPKGCAGAIALDRLPRLQVKGAADAVVEAGQELYRAAFAGELEEAYRDALLKAVNEGRGLRVELDLERGGDARSLPWELLHDGRQFLSMRSGGAVVRVVAAQEHLSAPPAVAPLRVLVTISSPRTLPWLGGEEERRRIDAAVAPLVTLGLMELTIAPDGSLNTMRRMIASADAAGRPFHGWHFIGHGEFDEGSNYGTLAMTDEKQDVHRVSGWELGTLLREHPSLHFAILNACEGARTSPRGPMFGVATSLIEAAVPRVVAMQFPITDGAAVAFAEEFYGALADGASFDEAVVEGRRGIFFRPNVLEWFTPVVFMAGTADGNVALRHGGSTHK